MELKSTDSLLMVYTINNVSGLTCYTTQTNTVILPLQDLSILNMGKISIPMFSGTEKKSIGMYCWPDGDAFVYRVISRYSINIPFIINESYLLR